MNEFVRGFRDGVVLFFLVVIVIAFLKLYRRDLRDLAEEFWVRVSIFFAWYDFWVGAYFDRKERVLYVCPIPCIVIKIDLMTYYEIVGAYTGRVIGACDAGATRDVLEEEPKATLRPVSKSKYLKRLESL